MDRKNSFTAPLKAHAKALRDYLSEQGIELGHSKCLEAIARTHGFKNWDTASAAIAQTVRELPSGEKVAKDIPFAVIMTRTEWYGDPTGHDAYDYFDRSFLRPDGTTIMGGPDPAAVHAALRDGHAIPTGLGMRLVAICYSEKEYETAWERLTAAFKEMAPVRRAALWRVIFEQRYPYPERLARGPDALYKLPPPDEDKAVGSAEEAFHAWTAYAESLEEDQDELIDGSFRAHALTRWLRVRVAKMDEAMQNGHDYTRERGLAWRILQFLEKEAANGSMAEVLKVLTEERADS